jgi:hypothetical protein
MVGDQLVTGHFSWTFAVQLLFLTLLGEPLAFSLVPRRAKPG